MDEEEFQQIQAALVASMNQNEEIVIASDEEADEGNGMIQNFMGMIGFGGGQGG